MKTLNLGIRMNQGDDFALMITVTGDSGPVDLTEYSFVGEMKRSTDGSDIADFIFTIQDQLTKRGQVLWSLPAATTALLGASVSDGEQRDRRTTPYVFDVKMKDSANKISRIIQGIIYLSPQVTTEAFP